MQAVNIRGIDTSAARSNISRMSEQISRSIRKIASGNNGYASENPSSIPFVERIKSAIAQNILDIRNLRDHMGEMQVQQAGALMKVDVISRIKELAIQYKNGTLSDSDRSDIQTQVDELSKLLKDGSMSAGFSPSVKIADVSTMDMSDTADLKVISSVNDGESQFVLFLSGGSADSDLSSLLSGNTEFMNSVRGEKPNEYVYQADGAEKEQSMFDLSSDGILSEIDKSLESYAGSAARITSRLHTMQYRLDDLEGKQGLLKEQLDNLTATDLAEETAKLIKSQITMQVGVSVLAAHANFEKSMVTALLQAAF